MSNQEIIKALVKAQTELTTPVKDKVNHYKQAYSSLDAIYASIRLPLAQNGMTIGHTVLKDGEHFKLVTTILHVSGEFIANEIPMFIEKTGSQGFASALTYARRYAITSLLALAADDDDDGEASMKPPEQSQMSDAQIKILEDLGSKNPAVREKILKSMRVNNFKELKNLGVDPMTIKRMVDALQVQPRE